VLENVWKFGFHIAEAKSSFAENVEKFSKKNFFKQKFKKKKRKN
jgi:hypothetical protein